MKQVRFDPIMEEPFLGQSPQEGDSESRPENVEGDHSHEIPEIENPKVRGLERFGIGFRFLLQHTVYVGLFGLILILFTVMNFQFAKQFTGGIFSFNCLFLK